MFLQDNSDGSDEEFGLRRIKNRGPSRKGFGKTELSDSDATDDGDEEQNVRRVSNNDRHDGNKDSDAEFYSPKKRFIWKCFSDKS